MKKIILLIIILTCFSMTANAALTDDIVAYYKFDATSGDVVDEIDNYNGTNNGATRGITGIINDAFGFDGIDSNEYVTIGTGSDYNDICTNGCSFSAWIYNNDSSERGEIIGRWDTTNDDRFFLTRIKYGNELIFLLSDDGVDFCITKYSGSNFMNNWNHITSVYNLTHLIIYLNGTEVNSSACGLTINQSAWSDSEDTFIGTTDETDIQNEWSGYLDEIGIWDGSLSASEVSDLYNNGTGLSYPFGSGASNASESEGDTAIQSGIDNSELTTETTYSNQKVYVVYANGTHKQGTVDKLVTQGADNWLLNYVVTPESNLSFWSSNSIYSWENESLSTSMISSQVETFINQTI